MTPMFRQLQRLAAANSPIRAGVIGAGFMGRGIVYQLSRTLGMRPAFISNRTIEHAILAFELAGFNPKHVLVSDDPRALSTAVLEGRPCASSTSEIAGAIAALDVVIEATGVVELGAREALACFRNTKHFISLNAETDGTVGCLLKKKADDAGVVYSNSDGDQPGVIMRLVEYCRGCGFEVMAAINCKGFIDIHATPDSVVEWSRKQNTSPRMTAAFTDGTKMNIEQTVVANATGLIPARRGMLGITSSMKSALADFVKSGVLETGKRIVDYTLGGDFGGGVFIIAKAEHPQMVQPYLKYLKMGDGPNYLFYRPYHLCHVETPLSAAEAVIFREPTIAPMGKPVAHTITLAKRDLKAGEVLDGIGGFKQYGQIDLVENCKGLLPVGLAENVKLKRDIKMDQPIPMDAVELDESKLLTKLWREQEKMS